MSPKKNYKLGFSYNHDKRNLSKWTRQRLNKILLTHKDNLSLTNCMKNREKDKTTVNEESKKCEYDKHVMDVESTEQYISQNDVIQNNEADIIPGCSSEKSNYVTEDEYEQNIIYNSSSDEESEEEFYEKFGEECNEEFARKYDEPRTDFNTENVFDLKKDCRIMFNDSNFTVSEVLLMIKGIIIKYNLTKDLQIALLQLIKSLAGSRFSNWNYTPYLMSKLLKTPNDKVKKHFFCSDCNIKLLTIEGIPNISKAVKCDKCEKTIRISSQSTNCFTTVDIKYQLELLFNRREIQLDMDLFQKQIFHNNDNMHDVYDSDLYKKIQMELPGALTFNFNTDGAQLFNSAKKSLWPIQLHVNELTPAIRFKNIILGGLYQSEKEPTPAFMNMYLSVFVDECEVLRLVGVDVIDYRTRIIRNVKVVPMSACVDSVARPLLQNRIKFNGFFGCGYCHHHGKYASGSMRYPLLQNDPNLRSHEEHTQDVQKVAKFGKFINGVKGESILLKLKNFNIIWNIPPDYMHAVLLGVLRQLYRHWNECYFNKADREEIKARMNNIKLCRDIRRNIRSLDLFDKYKATELRTWLLFVSLPCLYGILPNEWFQSYALFVSSVYTLLQVSITESDISTCQYKLLKFVGECQIYYDIKFMTFNVHCLLHFQVAVRNSGPLWCASAFPFENGIYLFMRQMNAPNGCVKQIAEKWLKKAEFESYLSNEKSLSPAIEYCKFLFINRKPLQNVTVIDKVTLVGSGKDNVKVQNYFRNLTTNDMLRVKVYDHCIYDSMFIHSVKYKRVKKTNDSVIETVTGEIVQMHDIVTTGNECYVYGKIWSISPNNFNEEPESPTVSHIFRVQKKSSSYTALKVDKISRKVIVIDIQTDLYISFLPNVFEIQ